MESAATTPVPQFIHPFANLERAARRSWSSMPPPASLSSPTSPKFPSSESVSASFHARSESSSATWPRPLHLHLSRSGPFDHQHVHASEEASEDAMRFGDTRSTQSQTRRTQTNQHQWVWNVTNADVPCIPAFFPPMATPTCRTLKKTSIHAVAAQLSAHARMHSWMSKYDTNHARIECTTSNLLKFEIQLWHPTPTEAGADLHLAASLVSPRKHPRSKRAMNSQRNPADIIVEVRRLRGCSVEFHHVRRALLLLLTRSDRAMRTAQAAEAESATFAHQSSDATAIASTVANTVTEADTASINTSNIIAGASSTDASITNASTNASVNINANAGTTRVRMSIHRRGEAPLESHLAESQTIEQNQPQLQRHRQQRRPSGRIIQLYRSDNGLPSPLCADDIYGFSDDLADESIHEELDNCVELLLECDGAVDARPSPQMTGRQGRENKRHLACERLSILTDDSKTHPDIAKQVATIILDDENETGRMLRNGLEDCFLQESYAMSTHAYVTPPFSTKGTRTGTMNAVYLDAATFRAPIHRQSSGSQNIQYLALRVLVQSLELILQSSRQAAASLGNSRADDLTSHPDAARSVDMLAIDFQHPFWQTVIQRCWFYLEWCSECVCLASLAATGLSVVMEYEDIQRQHRQRTHRTMAEQRHRQHNFKAEARIDANDAANDSRAFVEQDELEYIYPIVLEAMEYGQSHHLRLERASQRLLDAVRRSCDHDC